MTIKNHLAALLKNPAVRYLIVGGTSFLVDAGLLFILHDIANLSIVIAGSIAFWIGVIYNFTLTRLWTFSVRDKQQLHKHILLYAMLLAFNYISTIILLALLSNVMHFIIAKTLIVAAQTVWNYPIYKFIIFRK